MSVIGPPAGDPLRPGGPTIRFGELDGVPVLAADPAMGGHLQATLLFGVGRADETILNAGITHLIEHLALTDVRHRPYYWNGSVTAVSTRFVVRGSPADITSFLGHVTRALAALPMDRAAATLRVLAVEGEHRRPGDVDHELSLRLGPTGAGTAGWPEYGLRRVQPEDVVQWAATHFTAANAVLCVTGALPTKLRLDALPPGERTARPAPALLPHPARPWVPARTDRVSVSVVAGEQRALTAAMRIAQRRALDAFRHREAISYSVLASAHRIGGGLSLHHLSADGGRRSGVRLHDGLGSLMEHLATAGPTPAELDEIRAVRAFELAERQRPAREMVDAAERHLLGLPYVTAREADQAWAAMTPSDVAQAVAGATPTLWSRGPEEMGEIRPNWTFHGRWSRARVAGHAYQPVRGRERGTLYVGPEGVTWEMDATHGRTVLWRNVVARIDDGRGLRELLSGDGTSVIIAPWSWVGGEGLTAEVDRRVGPAISVPLPAAADAGTATDPRHLATIIGARMRKERIDVVVRTDGILVLVTPAGDSRGADRREQLRRADQRAADMDPTHRQWWAERRVRAVTLVRAGLRSFDGWPWQATIEVEGDRPTRFQLRDDTDARQFADGAARMLGPRYTGPLLV